MSEFSIGKYGAYLFVGGAILGSLIAASTTTLLIYVYFKRERLMEYDQEEEDFYNDDAEEEEDARVISNGDTKGKNRQNDYGNNVLHKFVQSTPKSQPRCRGYSEENRPMNGQPVSKLTEAIHLNGQENGIIDKFNKVSIAQSTKDGSSILFVDEKGYPVHETPNRSKSAPRIHSFMQSAQKPVSSSNGVNSNGTTPFVSVSGHLPPFTTNGQFEHPVTASTYSAGIPRTPTVDSAKIMVNQGQRIEEAAIHDEYCRIMTPEMVMSEEIEEVCNMVGECLDLRQKWLYKPYVMPYKMPLCDPAVYPSDVSPLPPEFVHLPRLNYHYQMEQGVVHVYKDSSCRQLLYGPVGNSREFFTDMHQLLKVQAFGPVKTFTHHRLMLLEQKFSMHVMLNADKEFLAQKTAPHRDFYNVRKVDTHIHHSACMHQKHLLRFIKSKLRCEPDEVVIFRDGKYLTVKEVFESLNLTSYDLNVDTLDMHVDKNTFHRFDRFNLKYNPCGQSRLREVFLKNDNVIHGRYLGELTKEVLTDLEFNKYQHTEFRISIYGRKQVEWDILAQWISKYNLYSNNNVWLIQIPRLYNIYYSQGLLENFQQMLDNIFLPLFEVTLDPTTHPNLSVFLQNVVGFDSVDDESKPERRPTKTNLSPEEWNHGHNPAYSYYTYYFYANLYVLNRLREERGLNTFAYRPHCGEAGDIDHLATAFMTAENIAHGCNLRKSPCLQYLYYVTQIGLCMSPLSNNSLFLDYHRNPFPQFFAKGLNVSLSSDDPLQIHLTREPLVEEYSVAAQVWRLSSADLCEIARNGVLHSGYPHACKAHWVGEQYWRVGPEGNDIKKTNVPNLRIRYRYDTLTNELRLLQQGAMAHLVRQKQLMEMQESL